MPVIRIFNGKRYQAHASYAKKFDAKKQAFQQRIGGKRLARVVKEGSYWVVYVR